jgi:hypothetical protein
MHVNNLDSNVITGLSTILVTPEILAASAVVDFALLVRHEVYLTPEYPLRPVPQVPQ